MDMDNDEKIQYWIEISEYDLGTADAMYQTGRYLYVGFMCHQAIEKILKAFYVFIYNDTPPYSHNLTFLAEESRIYDGFSEQQKDFIDLLDPLNIKARYPAYKEYLSKIVDERNAREILSNTKELHQWIKQRLLKS